MLQPRRSASVSSGDPGAHVVRDVGDRDPQARAALRQRLDGDRVVEVARGLGIDGGEGDVAQVGAIDAIGVEHLGRYPVGDARDVVRKRFLDVGAGQHLLDLGARVVGIAEHLEHGGLDRSVGDVGIAGDLRDDGDAVGRVRHRPAQRDRAGDARIVGLQHLLLAPAGQLAGDLRAPAGEHAQHAAFDAADGGPGLDFDGVGVHGGAAVAGRDVNVFGLVVGDDEAVPGGMNLDATSEFTSGEAREAGAARSVIDCQLSSYFCERSPRVTARRSPLGARSA